MENEPEISTDRKNRGYLTAIGAWALAFGCSVGWGAFVMPGTTFLPLAGPVGTALGLGIGALVMLLLAANYHYLMNCFPGCGGAYTYTKRCFGYDHGFVSAWFLIITYVAIIWANATALPLIARTLLGSAFQFGFYYVIAGYHVYLGEILLAVAALLIAALVCLHRKAAERCCCSAVWCCALPAPRPGPARTGLLPRPTPLRTAGSAGCLRYLPLRPGLLWGSNRFPTPRRRPVFRSGALLRSFWLRSSRRGSRISSFPCWPLRRCRRALPPGSNTFRISARMAAFPPIRFS